MTPRERRQIVLELIASRLVAIKADRLLKQCGSTPPTVYRVLNGGDHKISTLVEIADALDCDVQVIIHRRA